MSHKRVEYDIAQINNPPTIIPGNLALPSLKSGIKHIIQPIKMILAESIWIKCSLKIIITLLEF